MSNAQFTRRHHKFSFLSGLDDLEKQSRLKRKQEREFVAWKSRRAAFCANVLDTLNEAVYFYDAHTVSNKAPLKVVVAVSDQTAEAYSCDWSKESATKRSNADENNGTGTFFVTIRYAEKNIEEFRSRVIRALRLAFCNLQAMRAGTDSVIVVFHCESVLDMRLEEGASPFADRPRC